MKWYDYWKEFRMNWHQSLGMGGDNYRFHDHENLAHYANAACDIEFKFPFGFKELEGIHSRTDFDLKSTSFEMKKLLVFALFLGINAYDITPGSNSVQGTYFYLNIFSIIESCGNCNPHFENSHLETGCYKIGHFEKPCLPCYQLHRLDLTTF